VQNFAEAKEYTKNWHKFFRPGRSTADALIPTVDLQRDKNLIYASKGIANCIISEQHK
jgi:hypothetical protein